MLAEPLLGQYKAKPSIFSCMLSTTESEGLMRRVMSALDLTQLRRRYLDQDEFLYLEEFLPAELLRRWSDELEELKPHIHRNYLPGHKKGGSVGYATIKASAPGIDAFYSSVAFGEFLHRIVDAPLKTCPEWDPHRCALYAYTEEGDHIGFHYDTSYYKDRRWTALIGVKDESNSRLLCHLHTKNPNHPVEKLDIRVNPGSLVFFNGDSVYHAVTPTKEGEERFVVSMQFVTSGEMNPFLRLFSNLKDAFGYFGLKEVFLGR